MSSRRKAVKCPLGHSKVLLTANPIPITVGDDYNRDIGWLPGLLMNLCLTCGVVFVSKSERKAEVADE